MGLISSVMGGALRGAGEAGVKLGLNEQEALIQKDRDARIAEAAQELQAQRQAGAESLQKQGNEAADLRQGRTIQAQQVEGTLNREQRATEIEASGARDERQHTERMAVLGKQISQQAAQIKMEQSKVDMLQATHSLDVKQKKAIDTARDAYVSEPDPEKKIELGAQYMTLLGKVGERYKPIESMDPTTMEKKVTGFVDTLSGKVIGPQGKSSKKGASAEPPQAAIDLLRKNPKVAPQFKEKYGVDPAQYLQESSAAVSVPGRPLYNAKSTDLTRLASRPKGVSVAQAREAQAELDTRKGEARMSGG